MPSSQSETKYAKELHERIRREFPEVRVPVFKKILPHWQQLRIYKFWDRPVGQFFSSSTLPVIDQSM